MLSWLMGKKAKDWDYYESIFEDYPNACIYVDEDGTIKVIKVSDIDEFWGIGTVILEWGKIPKLTPWFVKMEHYVAIPTAKEEVYKKLVRDLGLKGFASYEPEFGGGFAIYECKNCLEKQRKHFEIFRKENDLSPEQVIEEHLKVMKS